MKSFRKRNENVGRRQDQTFLLGGLRACMLRALYSGLYIGGLQWAVLEARGFVEFALSLAPHSA